MNRYLRMVFKTDQDKLAAIRVSTPREDLNAADVKGVMETIIANGSVFTRVGDLVAIDSAYLVETSTTELEVAQ
ncbi:DUF2922 domain-containing protein [Natronincola ferrireducens]|uniref:DUF2922 domain-containing protein n=1 Tax=Natronincola ferrireducens TaxID=393762 RepID=A0A1G9IDJ8_9FIRM|nr:DUF2922 domain-containing protein [Natronincola ferrireducens]SDL23186.1 Protein of unknown function [Natronincola ferrireducens]